MAFYSIDPWGEQRADMRMARAASLIARPSYKSDIDPSDLMLFPDDAHDLPDDVDAQEKAWMLKLNRSA